MISCQRSAVSGQPSAVSLQPSAFSRQLILFNSKYRGIGFDAVTHSPLADS
ncbi:MULTISPECIES: hypothetical protein [unclassified Moorena]|uniref:hypothetical protein n=1 Tax=unclassified Moorena TaxID=2683338 RepID=UPI0013B78D29|nr:MULTISPECIES: hypothetical protein [unclassified Moorena]NEQ06426.1 hypothetical protein [Moorena sp. SIO4E2]NES41420.1 hypothetical protein [Moorena sp. SIO2C4]